MSMQKTFGIIKPDAVKAGNTGAIITDIEKANFNILGMKKVTLTKSQAEEFYAVHSDRPFFGELVEFMTSGPLVLLCLEKANAIEEWRNTMGATNPAEAAEGTMRKKYGANVGENATHGSDAVETAEVELKFFFPEIVG